MWSGQRLLGLGLELKVFFHFLNLTLRMTASESAKRGGLLSLKDELRVLHEAPTGLLKASGRGGCFWRFREPFWLAW